MVDSGLPADSFYTAQAAGAFYVGSGTSESASFCVSPGSVVGLEYTSGSWESENSYSISDSDGNSVFTDGPAPATGSVGWWFVGTDCDDADSSTYGDDDGDGVLECE